MIPEEKVEIPALRNPVIASQDKALLIVFLFNSENSCYEMAFGICSREQEKFAELTQVRKLLENYNIGTKSTQDFLELLRGRVALS